MSKESEKLYNIIMELDIFLNEKLEAIDTLKSMLKENLKIVNPDINGIEMAYRDIKCKLDTLKNSYKIEENTRDTNVIVQELTNENERLKREKQEARDFVKDYMYENYCYCGSEDRLLDILGDD